MGFAGSISIYLSIKIGRTEFSFKKKHVNRDAHIASTPISSSSCFEEVCCSILASSQRKLRGNIEFLFDVTIKEFEGFYRFSPNFVQNIT